MKQSKIKDFDSLKQYCKTSSVLRIENNTPPTPPNTPSIPTINLLLLYKTPIAIIIGNKIFSPDYDKYLDMIPASENNYIRKIFERYNSIIKKFSIIVTMDAFIEYVYEYLEYKTKQYNQLIIQDFIRRLR